MRLIRQRKTEEANENTRKFLIQENNSKCFQQFFQIDQKRENKIKINENNQDDVSSHLSHRRKRLRALLAKEEEMYKMEKNSFVSKYQETSKQGQIQKLKKKINEISKELTSDKDSHVLSCSTKMDDYNMVLEKKRNTLEEREGTFPLQSKVESDNVLLKKQLGNFLKSQVEEKRLKRLHEEAKKEKEGILIDEMMQQLKIEHDEEEIDKKMRKKYLAQEMMRQVELEKMKRDSVKKEEKLKIDGEILFESLKRVPQKEINRGQYEEYERLIKQTQMTNEEKMMEIINKEQENLRQKQDRKDNIYQQARIDLQKDVSQTLEEQIKDRNRMKQLQYEEKQKQMQECSTDAENYLKEKEMESKLKKMKQDEYKKYLLGQQGIEI